MSKHYNPEMQTFDFVSFKVIYIAPMKALVREVVGNFTNCLKHYNMKVGESGDSLMMKQQISKVSIIVATPEKWGVITWKQTDMSYTNLVRLLIIDESHLLQQSGGWNKWENMSSWLVCL